MKKKLIVTSLMLAMVASLAACGKDESVLTTEAPELSGTEVVEDPGKLPDPATYVTKLCDYKGIDIVLEGDFAVTDEAVTDVIENLMVDRGMNLVEATDHDVVREDDIVNVDYKGIQDGVAFEGGTAEGQILDVAGNCSLDGMGFIDNFTSGIVGGKVGEVVSSECTFPEEYGNADLAGQTVIFEFTINAIYTEAGYEELTDEMVEGNLAADFGVKTKQELYDFVYSYMESQNMQQYIQNYVVTNSEFTVPDYYMEYRLDELQEYYGQQYGGVEQFVSMVELSGSTMEDVRAQWKEGLTKQIGAEMCFLYIAQIENITVDETEFDTMISSYLVTNGGQYQTKDEVFASNGSGDAKQGEQNLRDQYLRGEAFAFILDNANKSE